MRTFDNVQKVTCKLNVPQECELELRDGTKTLEADTVLSVNAPVRFVDDEPMVQFGDEDTDPLECGLSEDDGTVLVCEGELNGNEYEFESEG